jgi:hypothetical protein
MSKIKAEELVEKFPFISQREIKYSSECISQREIKYSVNVFFEEK